jgi:hypothetical protein
MRSLTTLVVLAKFILTDELLPAFAVANLVGGEFSSQKLFDIVRS